MPQATICPTHGLVLAPHQCSTTTKRQERTGPSRPELRTNHWHKARSSARHRDGNACTQCGSTHKLSVHHIGAANDHQLDNLTTLCDRCPVAYTATAKATITRSCQQCGSPFTDTTGRRGRPRRYCDEHSGSTAELERSRNRIGKQELAARPTPLRS